MTRESCRIFSRFFPHKKKYEKIIKILALIFFPAAPPIADLTTLTGCGPESDSMYHIAAGRSDLRYGFYWGKAQGLLVS